MFSCDYNGWADVPEEEREGIDAFEFSTRTLAKQGWMPLVIEAAPIASQDLPQRLAA